MFYTVTYHHVLHFGCKHSSYLLGALDPKKNSFLAVVAFSKKKKKEKLKAVSPIFALSQHSKQTTLLALRSRGGQQKKRTNHIMQLLSNSDFSL